MQRQGRRQGGEQRRRCRGPNQRHFERCSTTRRVDQDRWQSHGVNKVHVYCRIHVINSSSSSSRHRGRDSRRGGQATCSRDLQHRAQHRNGQARSCSSHTSGGGGGGRGYQWGRCLDRSLGDDPTPRRTTGATRSNRTGDSSSSRARPSGRGGLSGLTRRPKQQGVRDAEGRLTPVRSSSSWHNCCQPDASIRRGVWRGAA